MEGKVVQSPPTGDNEENVDDPLPNTSYQKRLGHCLSRALQNKCRSKLDSVLGVSDLKKHALQNTSCKTSSDFLAAPIAFHRNRVHAAAFRIGDRVYLGLPVSLE